MERKLSCRKKLLKIAAICAVLVCAVQGCRAVTRHFEELRQRDPYQDAVGLSFPGSFGYRLGIPDAYRKAFDNCHQFLELKRKAGAPYIVNDQKREYLVVTELTTNLYDSVKMCEAPEGEPAEHWSDWMEVLPALESDGEYWSFCYPVTKVSYLYEEATYELTGDYGQVIVNQENNKVVGYVFPEYLKDE